MKKLTLGILLVLALLTTSCTSTNFPQLPDTAKSVCNLYQNAKPKVVALREWVTTNWDATVPGTDTPVIPADVKALLKEFDSYLPELDAAGKLVCSITDPNVKPAALKQKRQVNWDRVFAVTVQVVDLATRFQQSKSL